MSEAILRDVLVPDLHARDDILGRITDEYPADTYRLIFLGDMIDGAEGNSRACLEVVRGLGASAMFILGNHELTLLGAFTSDRSDQGGWIENWLHYDRDSKATMGDYGIELDRSDPLASLVEMSGKMKEVGHLQLLQGASLYELNKKAGYLAVHAGFSRRGKLKHQMRSLDQINLKDVGQTLTSIPSQLCSLTNAKETLRLQGLSQQMTHVTGHVHRIPHGEQSVRPGRVRLASWRSDYGTGGAYVWESWSKKVVWIPAS